MATVKDQVTEVLSDPINLPPEFLNYLMQYASMNALPSAALSAPILNSTGLTGATKSSRLVGATTSGPPTQGTFQAGDVVPAKDGHWWICTLAGAPGTWVDASTAPIQSAADVTLAGNMHLTATGNSMETASVLTLKSGVSDPVVAPILSAVAGGSLASETTYVVAYTWVDGTHESALSPTASITTKNTVWGSEPIWAIQVSVPDLPSTVTGFRIYWSTAGTTKLQAYPAYVSSQTSPAVWATENASGAAAPAATNFPTGTPSLIEDAAGNHLLSGDGSIGPKPVLATGAGHTVDDVITVLQNIHIVRQS